MDYSTSELEILQDTYNKWLESMPDFPPFSIIRDLKFNFNPSIASFDPVSKKISRSPITKKQLVLTFSQLTNFALSQIKTGDLIIDLSPNDIQYLKIDVMAEQHRINQLKLFNDYDEQEIEYVNLLTQWLDNEKKYFTELIPELRKLPEPKPAPKSIPHQIKNDNIESNNIENTNPMTLTILNDICYGRLKPWTVDFADTSKLSSTVRKASQIIIVSPSSLIDKLSFLLAEYNEYKPFLTLKPTFEAIIPIPMTFDVKVSQTLPRIFYKELIDTESIRYYNEVLANPLVKDESLDVEYQIGRKVLDSLKDLICKTKEEMQTLQTMQDTKDADDHSLFVMSYLHNSLLSLFFSIQNNYLPYLSDPFASVDEFYLYVFNETNKDILLKESVISNIHLQNDPSATKNPTPKVAVGKRLTFGFKYFEDKAKISIIRHIVKDLIDEVNFINDAESDLEDFITLTTSRKYIPKSHKIMLDCQTTLFTYIIEKFANYYSSLTAINIGRSECFYTKNSGVLTESNYNASKSKRSIKSELKQKVDIIFDKHEEKKG